MIDFCILLHGRRLLWLITVTGKCEFWQCALMARSWTFAVMVPVVVLWTLALHTLVFPHRGTKRSHRCLPLMQVNFWTAVWPRRQSWNLSWKTSTSPSRQKITCEDYLCVRA